MIFARKNTKRKTFVCINLVPFAGIIQSRFSGFDLRLSIHRINNEQSTTPIRCDKKTKKKNLLDTENSKLRKMRQGDLFFSGYIIFSLWAGLFPFQRELLL
jgi:hypothetical protein